jgi:hypothetical protein
MSGPRVVRPSPPEEHQPDKGYEESHGYGPSHGGPTGPGDAPAKLPEKEAPVDPDDSHDDEDEDDDSER